MNRTMPTTPEDRRHLAEQFDGCLATHARMLDRAIASEFDQRLRELDIRSQQVTLRVSIAGAEPATAAQLTRALSIDQTTLSRTLRRLQDQGLIKAVESDDARATPLRLTGEGERVLRIALEHWRSAQETVRERLGETLAKSVIRAAKRATAD